MWGRGLKQDIDKQRHPEKYVAPHVGAWIETSLLMSILLKSQVAPHVGAWIETVEVRNPFHRSQVAPHVGAWIETAMRLAMRLSVGSPLMWGRGLKQNEDKFGFCTVSSPLMWGRGLKLDIPVVTLDELKSPLMWGRGLKQEGGTEPQLTVGRPSCGGVD